LRMAQELCFERGGFTTYEIPWLEILAGVLPLSRSDQKLGPIESAQGPFCKDPTPLHQTHPGIVAIAEVATRTPLVVISAYGLIDHGYADSTMHRILSDLTPLFDERKCKGIVVAGDFNVSTQWSAKHRSTCQGRHKECHARCVNLFARFEALGLSNVVLRNDATPLPGCDCPFGLACRHVHTQHHERSEFPWQNDYIFLSQDLLALNPTVEVFDRDDAWRLSGHCPIAVDLPGVK
jgi:endonuclease/exonuclease/phosphatase family metal-dependent hydrolase